jgi:dihydroceramidase
MGFLSWSYREDPYPPYWGPINSQANYCEEDYIMTTYIAEFINTLTNITYLLYAFHGVRSNSKRPDAFLRNLPYFGLAGVGIGSIIFHSSLKFYTQWADELSMLIATSTVFHRIFTFDKPSPYTLKFGVILFTILTIFIIWHCAVDELVMHSAVFGIMVTLITIKVSFVIPDRISNSSVRSDLTRLAIFGAVSFLTGFTLWNIDQIFCSSITQAKRSIGMPWSFVLELHGWWHILTGVGVYIFIALVEYLTSEEAGLQLGSNFAWPVGWLVDMSPTNDPKMMNDSLQTSDGEANDMPEVGEQSRLISEPASRRGLSRS